MGFGVQSNVPHDHEQQGEETFSYQSRSLQFIENKTKHMERELSSAKRGQVLIDDARKDLAEGMLVK